jgi:hypothetical protein
MQALRDREALAEVLRVLGLIVLALDDPETTGRLLGASERIVEETAVIPAELPHELALDAEARRSLRDILGDEGLAAVLAEGKELSDTDALDLALAALAAGSPR